MQTIIEYLLSQLESEDVEEIDVDDVYGFLLYLVDNEMAPDQIQDEIGLYEFEINRVAFEGGLARNILGRLLTATAVPAKGYVVGL